MKMHFKYNKKCSRYPGPNSTIDAAKVTCKNCLKHFIIKHELVTLDKIPKPVAVNARYAKGRKGIIVICPVCGQKTSHGSEGSYKVSDCMCGINGYHPFVDLPKRLCGFECNKCEFTDKNCPGKEYAMKYLNEINLHRS